jgi:hypothetical protein
MFEDNLKYSYTPILLHGSLVTLSGVGITPNSKQ